MTGTDPLRLPSAHEPPVTATVEIAVAAAQGTGSPLVERPRTTPLLVLGIVGMSVLAVVTLGLAVYLLVHLGTVAFGVAGVMALVPLAIVLGGVRYIDRWEPEPRILLVICFLWGAGFAVVVSLIAGSVFDSVLAAASGSPEVSKLLSAVVRAPILEEGGKGLGLLLILLLARKHFDGPVDGVVFAAWVGGGFAFTENIIYFGTSVAERGIGGDLVEVFVVRGLMSPFAHVMFTACTGIALGLAARRTGWLGSIGAFVLGLLPAILLHALWNGSVYVVGDFIGYYVVVQLPLFVGALLLVRYLRRQEARLTYDRLSEYADVGWFSPGEVTSLATGYGRRQAQAWARSRGLGGVMRAYTRDATRLALTRQRIVTGRAARGAAAEEEMLLAAIVSERAVLQAALERD